jgi:hypothetical protein
MAVTGIIPGDQPAPADPQEVGPGQKMPTTPSVPPFSTMNNMDADGLQQLMVEITQQAYHPRIAIRKPPES